MSAPPRHPPRQCSAQGAPCGFHACTSPGMQKDRPYSQLTSAPAAKPCKCWPALYDLTDLHVPCKQRPPSKVISRVRSSTIMITFWARQHISPSVQDQRRCKLTGEGAGDGEPANPGESSQGEAWRCSSPGGCHDCRRPSCRLRGSCASIRSSYCRWACLQMTLLIPRVLLEAT